MISGWVVALSLFFTVLFGVVIVLLIRILTQNEIVIRAIPFGAPKIQERRPPASTQEVRVPVGANSTGRHG